MCKTSEYVITVMDPFFGYRSLNVGTDNYRSHGMEGPRGGLEASDGMGTRREELTLNCRSRLNT